MTEKLYTNEQQCPVCFALPDMPCDSGGGSKMSSVHVARRTVEFGRWCRVYDEKYRDKRLGFRIEKYGRRAA